MEGHRGGEGGGGVGGDGADTTSSDQSMERCGGLLVHTHLP